MRTMFALVALSLLATPAAAKPCRNSHGKFVKCAKVVKPVRCRDAKGHFAKCK